MKKSSVAGNLRTKSVKPLVDSIFTTTENLSNTFLQYDRNAIRMDNVMYQQIGHLPRKVVEKVAPYVVCRFLRMSNAVVFTSMNRIPETSFWKDSSPDQRMSTIVPSSSSFTGLVTLLSVPGL